MTKNNDYFDALSIPWKHQNTKKRRVSIRSFIHNLFYWLEGTVAGEIIPAITDPLKRVLLKETVWIPAYFSLVVSNDRKNLVMRYLFDDFIPFKNLVIKAVVEGLQTGFNNIVGNTDR